MIDCSLEECRSGQDSSGNPAKGGFWLEECSWNRVKANDWKDRCVGAELERIA